MAAGGESLLESPRADTATFGIYLGVPVLFLADLNNGWVRVQWPDREPPKKGKCWTYTGTGPDARGWLLWNAQVRWMAA